MCFVPKLWQWLIVLSFASAACEPTQTTTPDFAAERAQMAKEQIVMRGVVDNRVVAAMRKVPREEFVPAEFRNQSYADGPLPIGHGQTISQPYIVALMTEKLGVRPKDRVLEIGTGSGYQAAILAELGAEVYSIEILERWRKRRRQLSNDSATRMCTLRREMVTKAGPSRRPSTPVS